MNGQYRKVALLILPEIVGQSCIDGGVVTKYLVEFIKELSDMIVITNAVQIFKGLEENPNINLFSTGEVLRRNSGSLVGPIAENLLRDMCADKLFQTIYGVSIDFGLF